MFSHQHQQLGLRGATGQCIKANQELLNARPSAESSLRMSFNPSRPRFVVAGSSLLHSNRSARIDLSSSSRRKEAQISAEFKSETPYVASYEPPFRNAVIRNNLIRYVDNLNEDHLHPHEANIGISLTMAEDAIVENNLIDLGRPDPIQYRDCTSLHYFNNTTPAGKPLTGIQQPLLIAGMPQPPAEDISVLVGDSLLFSML